MQRVHGVRRPIPAAVLAAVVFSIPSPALAQALSLRPAPMVLSSDSLVSGAEVQLINSGPAAITVTGWRTEAFTAPGGATVPGTAATLARPVRVAARSRAVLVFSADSAAWKTAEGGRYESYLTVLYQGGSAEAQLVITRAAKAPTAPAPEPDARVPAKPFGRELTLYARAGNLGTFSDTVIVPALQGTEQGTDTFTLASKSTIPARARIGVPAPWKRDSTLQAYPVHLSLLRGGHTYTGTVQLGADTASAVTLTIHASHNIFWFLLTVALGWLAGMVMRHWTDLMRPISLLRERVLRAGPRFDRAAASYEAGGRRSAAALRAEFQKQQSEADDALRGLRRFYIKNDSVQKAFDAVSQQVDALEAQAAALGRLAPELQALDEVRRRLDSLLANARPPAEGEGVLPPTPRAVLAADETLSGEGVTLAAAEQVRTAAAAQRTLLARWAALYQDAAEKQAWLDRLHPPRDGEATHWENAVPALRKVWWDLWDAPDTAAFGTRQPEQDLVKVEDALREIAAARGPADVRKAGRPGTMDMAAAASASWVPWTVLAAPLPDTPQEQEALAEHVRLSRGLSDLTFAALSLAASLLVTLANDYYGKPFGTFDGYAKAFGWGFAITAGFALLGSGLAALQAAEVPRLPRRRAG